MAGKFKMPSIKDVEQEENKDVVVKEKFKVGAGLLSDISKGAVVMDVVIYHATRYKRILTTTTVYQVLTH